MNTPTIYLDMDGVFCNWVKAFEAGGRPISEFSGQSQKLWDYFIERFEGGKGFYRALEAFPGHEHFFLKVTGLARQYGYNVEFLTAAIKLAHVPTLGEEKTAWVREHLCPTTKVNMSPLAEHKQGWCKDGDILIDDHPLNISQWRAKGGIGIHHSNFDASLSELQSYLEKKHGTSTSYSPRTAAA